LIHKTIKRIKLAIYIIPSPNQQCIVSYWLLGCLSWHNLRSYVHSYGMRLLKLLKQLPMSPPPRCLQNPLLPRWYWMSIVWRKNCKEQWVIIPRSHQPRSN